MEGPDEPGRTASYLLLALGSTSYVCFTFVWFTLPAYLTTVIDEVGLSSTAAGVVVGAVPLTYVPFALLSGLLIDRIGPRRAIGAGLLLIGFGQAVRSAATGFPELLVLTLVLGLGGTGITFGLPKLVAVLFPSALAGRASSVYMVGSYAGMGAAFALGRPVLGPALGGWRPLFLWSGVAVAVFAAVWLLVPAGSGLDSQPRGGDDRGLAAIRADLRAILAHQGMRLLVVVGAASLLVVHGVMGWLAAILETRGFAAATAAGLTTLLVVARLAGTVTLPTLSDVLGARRGTLAGSGVLLTLGLAGLVAAGPMPALTVPAVVGVGFGLGGVVTLLRVIPIEYAAVGPDLTGTATGLIYSVGQVGGFLGPFLIGTLYATTGTHSFGLSVLVAAGAVAVVAAALMPDLDA